MVGLLTGTIGFAETVQDIVNGVVYARGGALKIASVQTERFTGTVYTTTQTGSFVLELKRPSKVRMQIVLGDQVVTKGFDGDTAWKLEGTSPAAKPAKMDGAEGDSFTQSQDIDGLLVGAAEKGTDIEIVNKEMLGSSLVWKLRVTPKKGDPQLCYVETSGSQLLMKETTSATADQKQAVTKQYFRDFRKVKDLSFPFVMTSVSEDNFDSTVTLVVESLLLNEPIADERFDFAKATADPIKP